VQKWYRDSGWFAATGAILITVPHLQSSSFAPVAEIAVVKNEPEKYPMIAAE
jgi:hypothetical protein